MSRIVLFGATGKVGRRILAEALDRRHRVIAVVRRPDAATALDPRAALTLPAGSRILDQPRFPSQYRASARGQADALAWYRARTPQSAASRGPTSHRLRELRGG